MNYLSLPRTLVGFFLKGGYAQEVVYYWLVFKEGRILRTTSPLPVLGWNVNIFSTYVKKRFHFCL